MATNGASARQWLAEHGQQKSADELQRIRNAIATKLEALSEDHPDEDGLLEALDVMDEWINNGGQPVAPAALGSNDAPAAEPMFDSSPLTPDLQPSEELSPAEKRARFQALLKTGHIPAGD
ncbi:hypothetical protein [Parendozoicomonas haliclonae]|uniref:Uncharacterized protein n=1 Tax=Parendozoicomonas haliclonae TaxID=1960125 RepID=A0A1X7AN07_9GAMM|nr:hypothetical protein [Parendozoicomonas haliclonae]SMA49448.1 hypothetical protein EHSB41UT_03268 [Parendozoicomonas haliclonae]